MQDSASSLRSRVESTLGPIVRRPRTARLACLSQPKYQIVLDQVGEQRGAAHRFAEPSMSDLESGSVGEKNEKATATRVRRGLGQNQRATGQPVGADLVAKSEARPPPAVSSRISALEESSRNSVMKACTVEEALIRQLHKAQAAQGNVRTVDLEDNIAALCLHLEPAHRTRSSEDTSVVTRRPRRRRGPGGRLRSPKLGEDRRCGNTSRMG